MKKTRVLLGSLMPLLVGIVGSSGLLYMVTQQLVRQQMNDPQVAMVDLIGTALSRGEVAQTLIPSREVNIQLELSSWVAVYDNDFNAVMGNGYFNGALARVPPGILQQPGAGITNKVTWQPAFGVRQALVVYTVPRAEGTVYVVAGRNMHEDEKRINLYGRMILLGTLLILSAVLFSARYLRGSSE